MANPGPGKSRKKGKNGNKKHGRNRKSMAMQRYNAERRDLKNKARRIAKAGK